MLTLLKLTFFLILKLLNETAPRSPSLQHPTRSLAFSFCIQQQARNHTFSNSKQKLVLDLFALSRRVSAKGSPSRRTWSYEGKKSTVLFFKACFFSVSEKNPPACLLPGDVYKEEIRVDEEGIRAERAMWLWDRADHFQQHQQAVPVRQHGHGQGAAQVHGVQRTAREPDELGHRGGERARLLGPEPAQPPAFNLPSSPPGLHRSTASCPNTCICPQVYPELSPGYYSTLSLCLPVQSESGMIVGTRWVCSLLETRRLVRLLISSSWVILVHPTVRPPEMGSVATGQLTHILDDISWFLLSVY